MMLRARVALHLGQRPPEPESEWTPERRAGAWEPGMDSVVSAECVIAAVPVSIGVDASQRVPVRPVPVMPVSPVPLITAPDTSRVRGEAYVHGVYRLFVRGQPRRTSPAVAAAIEASLPARVSAMATVVAPASARAPVLSSSPARAPAPVHRPARAPMPMMPMMPTMPTCAPVVAPVMMPAPAIVAPQACMAFGPDCGGFVRRVVDWPLVPGGRPALLGGALARLGLPDAERLRGLLPQLLTGAVPGASGSPLVFLDVETTALDRGAGALAFMVGLAAVVDGALRVEQWILTRLSAEAAMLAEVLARVVALGGAGAALASFNGASFDVPLLRTRLRRAGLPTASLERPHLDLLPLARRMWRGRGPDCRLITLERTQLGVRRVHDIEGHEIPAVFWAWLRNPGDPEVQAVMGRVADHNLADLVTLPALGAALGACLEAPADLDMAVRAAEHNLGAGRREQALGLLGDWLGRPAAPAQRRRALLLAADLLRRDDASRGRAAELWAEVCRICPGDPAAHEALAKHLEHHTGEFARALEVARGSVAPCPRRVARLRRKLAGSRSGPGPLRTGAQAC